MSEQEEYLDKLLNGINEESEDTLEDFSFEDSIEDGQDTLEEKALFDEEDSLLSAGRAQELDTGLDIPELGLGEEEFKLDEDGFKLNEEELKLDEDGFKLDEDGFKLDEEELKLDEEEFNLEEEEQGFNLDEDGFELEEEDLDFAYEPDAGSASDAEEQEALSDMGLGEFAGTLEMDLEEPAGTSDMAEESADTVEAGLEELQNPLDTGLDDTFSTKDDFIKEEPEDRTPEAIWKDEGEPETEMETAGEIDDAQALANVLNAFSEEEDSEEVLVEEAVLDAPEALGLELEEVEETGEVTEEAEEEEKQKKKKKEKRKKEKNQEKKPGLITRLLEDDADEEPTQEELEAEAAKKAEKEAKKQEKKAEAAEKKQQAKEAAAAKKAEKAAEKKRKAEAEEPPEPWPVFTKKITPFIVLFGATFVVLIVILSNVLSYSPYVANARKYFDDRQYEKAYEQLMGIKIKEKDEKFYEQVQLMSRLQVKVTSYENHLLNGEKELALNDLVQAVLFYNEYLEEGKTLGLEKEFQVVYENLTGCLSETFGISADEAAALGAVSNAEEYQEQISGIVN